MKRLYLILGLLSSFLNLTADTSSFFDGRLLVSADYLLMRMQQDGISYGTQYFVSGTQIPTNITVHGKEEDLFFPFKYESGLRVLLGWEDPCNLWGIKASYDYLYGSSHVQKVASGNFTFPGLAGSRLTPAFGNLANSANINNNSAQRLRADWNSNFNQADLFLDRKFECFRYLGLNFLLGLRGASINQHIQSSFATSGTTTVLGDEFPQAADQKERLKTQFYGVGVVSGVQANWFLWNGLYLYGFLKRALLASRTTFDLNSVEVQVLSDTSHLFVQEKHNANEGLKAALDLGIGIEYSISFCEDAYVFCLHTGWEHHQWFNQNFFRNALTNLQVADQQDQPLSGDFSVYGWVFGLDFLF